MDIVLHTLKDPATKKSNASSLSRSVDFSDPGISFDTIIWKSVRLVSAALKVASSLDLFASSILDLAIYRFTAR